MFSSRMPLMGFSCIMLYVQTKHFNYSFSDLTCVEYKHLACCFDAVFNIYQFSVLRKEVKTARTAMRVLICQTFLDNSLRRTSEQKGETLDQQDRPAGAR